MYNSVNGTFSLPPLGRRPLFVFLIRLLCLAGDRTHFLLELPAQPFPFIRVALCTTFFPAFFPLACEFIRILFHLICIFLPEMNLYPLFLLVEFCKRIPFLIIFRDALIFHSAVRVCLFLPLRRAPARTTQPRAAVNSDPALALGAFSEVDGAFGNTRHILILKASFPRCHAVAALPAHANAIFLFAAVLAGANSSTARTWANHSGCALPALTTVAVFHLCACHLDTSNMTVAERCETFRYCCLRHVYTWLDLAVAIYRTKIPAMRFIAARVVPPRGNHLFISL